jgi:Fe-S cluster assembly protein SufD
MMKQALPPSSGRPGKIADRELYTALGADLHGLSAHHLVFVDGAYSEEMSFIVGEEAGLFDFTALHEELKQPGDSFRKSFGNIAPLGRYDAAIALNAAFMRDGALIAIRDGVTVRRPIHLIHVSSATKDEAVFLRNMIRVGARASAAIIESHVHLRSHGLQCNIVSEVEMGEGARLDHVKYQHEGAKALHLSNWLTRLDRNARYRAFQLAIGAHIARSGINLVFAGEGAKADISAAALLRGAQHADLTMIVDHAAPACESRTLFKAVLDDEARAVFQGKLLVREGAQKTDAKQMAHGVMLAEGPEFDAKPELEIYADDVQCGHGATSGQLDEDMLFYMRQRGMSEETARSLLILAFIGEVMEKIANEDLREAFLASARAWLGSKSDE